MSILVKGMEMPKDCPYCPLAHWNFKGEFTGCEIKKKYFSTEELYTDGKPDFCPLVEVDGNEIDEAIKALKGVRDAYRIITEAFCRPQETDIGSKPK